MLQVADDTGAALLYADRFISRLERGLDEPVRERGPLLADAVLGEDVFKYFGRCDLAGNFTYYGNCKA